MLEITLVWGAVKELVEVVKLNRELNCHQGMSDAIAIARFVQPFFNTFIDTAFVEFDPVLIDLIHANAE